MATTISVIGFCTHQCESSELPSPRSSSSDRSSGASSGGPERSVSLLSLLLSAQQHASGSAAAMERCTAEDCFCDDDEDDCCYDEEGELGLDELQRATKPRAETQQRAMSALERAATAPMEVPNTT